ncbi:hypothetical protein WDW37_13565, partial [Bdellovibrionota bacterium FG-1]
MRTNGEFRVGVHEEAAALIGFINDESWNRRLEVVVIGIKINQSEIAFIGDVADEFPLDGVLCFHGEISCFDYSTLL